jgi:hypothetical protein
MVDRLGSCRCFALDCYIFELEKAARFVVGFLDQLTDFIEKQAGRGIPDPPELYTMLDRRMGKS